jgi:hypothetical protein
MQFIGAVIADDGLDALRSREAGFERGDVHDAAGVVLAEQRALRSPQHLHLVDVGEVERDLTGLGQIHPVDVYPDAGLESVVRRILAESADRDAGLAGIARFDDEVGDLFREILDGIVRVSLQRGSRHHGDRQRHIEQVLVALACGHHDLV